MNIYKLTPTNLDSIDWEASTYKGEVIVQAENERKARHIAQLSFGIAVALKPGRRLAMMPWPQAQRVECTLIGQNDETQEALLEPENA